MTEKRISFRLKPGRDDQIINWLEDVGDNDRSYHIREALRGFLNQGTSQATFSFQSSMNNKKDNSNCNNINNRSNNNSSKSVSEISEAELEKNLKGWAD